MSLEPAPDLEPVVPPDVPAPLDLDGIEADLAAVEVALGRLDAGEYWQDEVTGAPIADEDLEADPTRRRSRAG